MEGRSESSDGGLSFEGESDNGEGLNKVKVSYYINLKMSQSGISILRKTFFRGKLLSF